MKNNELEKDFQFYLDNLIDLEKKYKGKFIAIKNCKVIGSYTTYEEAFEETTKSNELGTFLIQKADTNPNNYMFTINRFTVVA